MATPIVFNADKFFTPKRPAFQFLQRKKDQIVDRHVVGGICLERVEACGRTATVFRRDTNIFFRRYEVDFDILNAVYATFSFYNNPNEAEVHLCLIGEWRIDFHELAHEGYCMLTLPFRICMAHRCGFGLLLERDCFSDLCEAEPDAAQLFSLTHPYNEFFPIVSKFKDETECHYAFRGRRIALLSDSWRLDTAEKWELISGYDLETRKKLVFRLRRCTREEKRSAKMEMWMDARGFFNLSVASPMSTAATTAHSFLSPNFFNTNFLTGGRATAATFASALVDNISPLTTQSSFASLGSGGRNSFGTVGFMSGVTPASSSSSRIITPTRRHCMLTRSMAAADSVPRFLHTSSAQKTVTSVRTARRSVLEFASSTDIFVSTEPQRGSMHANSVNLPITTSMNSLTSSADAPSIHRRRSANSNALLQYALTQQRRLRCTSTPINDVETERLLSFGRANSMECAVEFCLEWIEDVWELPRELSLECISSSATTVDTATQTASTSKTVAVNVRATAVSFSTSVLELTSTVKKPAVMPLDRRGRTQRLQMLDDLLLHKANSKCNSIYAWKLRETSAKMLAFEEGKYCRQRWGDNRLQNVRQMLDSSKAVLIPSKLDILIDNGEISPSTSQDERAQQLHFVVTTALKTVTRPFGQALLNFATVRPIANQPFVLSPICLNGKVSPNGMQIDYPNEDSNSK